MPKQSAYSIPLLFSVFETSGDPICSLIPGIDGDLQVAHSRSGQTVIDVQSVHFDVTGQVQHDHATMHLTYGSVCELRALLDRIARPMERHHPALLSGATSSRPVMQRTGGKRRVKV